MFLSSCATNPVSGIPDFVTITEGQEISIGASYHKQILENNKTPTLSLVECRLETGRTHHIRVHMTHMGNSILGDGKYKKKYKKLKNIEINLEKLIFKLGRQFLHAQTLGFNHPRTNKEMIFISILPNELENILSLLRNTNKLKP